MSTVVAASLLLWGCDRGYDAPPRTELDTPIPVQVAEVLAQAAEEHMTYAGSVEPLERANVASKVTGRIEAIVVSEGRAVAKGDLLVRLQSREIEARLAQAEAAIDEARVYYQNAEKDLKRFESLFEQKTATQKELDDVRAAWAGAKARLRVAEEAKAAIEELRGHVRLTAPFGGVVTRKFMDVGDLATPGQPIVQIENTRLLKVAARVPESAIQSLSLGMPVTIRIPSNVHAPSGEEYEARGHSRSFEATIDQILPSADPASHQFEIKMVLENSGGDLKSGMFARVSVVRSGGQSLMVPRTAIVERGQLQGVFAVDSEDRARLRWIRSGRVRGGAVEVLAGLEAGEFVVVHSEGRLRDRQLVKVKQ